MEFLLVLAFIWGMGLSMWIGFLDSYRKFNDKLALTFAYVGATMFITVSIIFGFLGFLSYVLVR